MTISHLEQRHSGDWKYRCDCKQRRVCIDNMERNWCSLIHREEIVRKKIFKVGKSPVQVSPNVVIADGKKAVL